MLMFGATRWSPVSPRFLVQRPLSSRRRREAERQGVYRGSEVDLSDGFIHFSTAQQVESTATRHLAAQKGLFLIAIDADALGDRLRWEPAREGALFPHLYGELDIAAVTAVFDMPLRADGTHKIPELSP